MTTTGFRATRIRWTPRALLLLVVIATGYAALQTLQVVIVLRTRTTLGGFAPDIFREHLTRAWIWAALTPLVFALGARFPLGGRRWPASVAALLGGSILVALIHVTATAFAAVHVSALADGPVISFRRVEAIRDSAGIDRIVRTDTTAPVMPQSPPGASSQLEYRVRSFLLGEWVIFWVVLGIYYLIDYHRRARDSEAATARLAARAAHLEASAAEARLRELQMELDPHFLFNTLNTIGSLVRQDQGRRAVQVIAKLGDVLRRGLARDREPTATVAEEVESARLYLELEQERFGGGLEVRVSVDPTASAARVPVLILQPLIENAARHGIGAETRGVIELVASMDGERVRLAVGDSGSGFPDGVAEGIGLSNTRSRLAALYGESARLLVRRSALGGAEVEVSFPAPAPAGP